MITPHSTAQTVAARSSPLTVGRSFITRAEPAFAQHWTLDPALTFLNHGSYGAVPRAVLAAQSGYRARQERDPVRFFKAELEGLLDGWRERMGAFLNCRPCDLAPMPNATVALCTILANTPLGPGDEVLITDHEYQSLLNELERVSAATGCRVVKAEIPFPIEDSELVAERVLAAVTERTKLVFVSHITSASSLVFPVTRIVRELNERGIDVVVDGAHSAGQIPVDVAGLRPTYFVGSGHKWLSAPKGTGFLWVRPDKQPGFRPIALSSRANKVRHDRALFLRDFDYMGTDDYTGILAIADAVEFLGGLMEGGWPALMRRNHEMVLEGRRIVCRALGVEEPAPASMIGTMASIPIPDCAPELKTRATKYDDALQDALLERHNLVAPIWRMGPDEMRIVRISAQLYNGVGDYERLAEGLLTELAREAGQGAGAGSLRRTA